MHRLTREVRMSLVEPASNAPVNGHSGWPAMDALAPWVTLQVTVSGDADSTTGYLLNIAEIDRVVRRNALPMLRRHTGGLAALPGALHHALGGSWPGASLERLRIGVSPFTAFACVAAELPMIRLSHRFEFSAAHRLHCDRMNDDENRRAFGKCNNPHGHGHNYELQVTVAGVPDGAGLLIGLPELEQIVIDTVITPLDHKNLNVEVPEFRELNPSVENIAMVIFRRLKPRFASSRAGLVSVTVWETPKTWCEYSE